MVYTSESAALATLEVSAHLDLSQDLPTDRYYIEIIIPDSIPILQMDIKEFPKGWDDRPPSLISQAIGDIFIKEGEFPVFRVPSAIVPLEFNYLINPLHPFSKVIKVVNTNPMVFDPRFQNTKASK